MQSVKTLLSRGDLVNGTTLPIFLTCFVHLFRALFTAFLHYFKAINCGTDSN